MTEITNKQYAAIDEIIRQLVLAHADREISSMAVVFLNKDHEAELEIAINPQGGIYSIIAGLDILKDEVKTMLTRRNRMKPKNRE